MIYCVEDDKAIRELIVYTLQNTGFEAEGFESADQLLPALHTRLPQLILLDIMLPGQDGISILKQLRRNGQTAGIPVILLTAKGTEYDKVIGLDSGADDYITKPFGMMELISRIKALLRRTASSEEERDKELRAGTVVLIPRSHKVTAEGRLVELTLKEFQLLYKMAAAPGRIFTRQQIMDDIWGLDTETDPHTVDVHIGRLRDRFRENPDFEIVTMRGIGYKVVKKA